MKRRTWFNGWHRLCVVVAALCGTLIIGTVAMAQTPEEMRILAEKTRKLLSQHVDLDESVCRAIGHWGGGAAEMRDRGSPLAYALTLLHQGMRDTPAWLPWLEAMMAEIYTGTLRMFTMAQVIFARLLTHGSSEFSRENAI